MTILFLHELSNSVLQFFSIWISYRSHKSKLTQSNVKLILVYHGIPYVLEKEIYLIL